MSKNHHGGPAPIPAGNLPNKGPMRGQGDREDANAPFPGDMQQGAPDSDKDPKRGTGNYTGKGEHARQQPGPLNDG